MQWSRWKWWIGALAAVLLLVFLIRIGRTAEAIALFGTVKQKSELCRAVPGLGASRQKRILTRLLADDSPAVRISAIAACGAIGSQPELDDELERILRDESSPHDVRVRAGEVLLQRVELRPSTEQFLQQRVHDREFRAGFPTLVAKYVEHELPEATARRRREIVQQSLQAPSPVRPYLRAIVLNEISLFRHSRDQFLAALAEDPKPQSQEFILSALTAIDGQMRGTTATDWTLDPSAAGDIGVVEAEWLYDIRPNYQIATFKGTRCLILDEGAGGFMPWLKGLNGTVDIGTARFSLFAPSDGHYQLWSRVYLSDKCGNSFRIWVDGKQLANFPNWHSILDRWHWLPLRYGNSSALYYAAGFHAARLQAREDAVYIDKFAFLPAGKKPGDAAGRPVARWDPSLRTSISFAVDRQAQSRGTTQRVVAWVRRNSPALEGGTVQLDVPLPFRIEGPSTKAVEFEKGDPLAMASFRVHLPRGVSVGEDVMRATYSDANGERFEGRMILGGQYDWLCTGPLSPEDPFQKRLGKKANLDDASLRTGWRPYPERGYDRYRRLDMEQAYGQLRNKFIYLYCDIEVTREDDYLALLTADDTATVFIDGSPAIAQPANGPAEGRLVMKRIHLTVGRHRLFVRLYQADFADPVGINRDRHNWNHCAFKFLLRKDRHTPAASIRGLPHKMH